MLRLWNAEQQCCLQVGEQTSFGRGGGIGGFSVSSDPRLHRVCGVITFLEGRGRVENRGSWLHMRVVKNNSGAVEFVAPGESAEIVWAESSLEICLGNEVVEVLVTQPAPELVATNPEVPRDLDGQPTMTPLALDRSSGYFRALVALCERALLSPRDPEIPSDQQVALRLWQSGKEAVRPSGKTIERRLDHCRCRAGLKDVAADGSSAGLERRNARGQLVEVAILTGTVTLADLELLDCAVPTSSR